MNNDLPNALCAALAPFAPLQSAVQTATRTKTSDLLNALRNWHPDHNDAQSFFDGIASCVKYGETGLSARCTAIVIDLCSEASSQIENDRIEQQSEQAWNDRKPLNQYFEPAFAQLDALTIRRTA